MKFLRNDSYLLLMEYIFEILSGVCWKMLDFNLCVKYITESINHVSNARLIALLSFVRKRFCCYPNEQDGV